jgi:uncharacterized protein (DUF433 family)
MFDRITHDPNILAGRATLRGLRISVNGPEGNGG